MKNCSSWTTIPTNDEATDPSKFPETSRLVFILHKYYIPHCRWDCVILPTMPAMSIPELQEVLFFPPLPKLVEHCINISQTPAEVRLGQCKLFLIHILLREVIW